MTSYLSSKKKYLQIALNGTLEDAAKIISQLPKSDRIIVEAGTPLIKRYGSDGIASIKRWLSARINGSSLASPNNTWGTPPASLNELVSILSGKNTTVTTHDEEIATSEDSAIIPYVVADLKMMDRGATEVEMVKEAGANAAIALGLAPIESLNSFIDACEKMELDAMIDMMNVEFPLTILRQLKKQPRVVILHRGVDETEFNKEKQIPLHEIRRIKSNYGIMLSIAGGDTIREVQRAVFNDADIVIVWKSFLQSTSDTSQLAQDFLKEIQ